MPAGESSAWAKRQIANFVGPYTATEEEKTSMENEMNQIEKNSISTKSPTGGFHVWIVKRKYYNLSRVLWISMEPLIDWLNYTFYYKILQRGHRPQNIYN